MTAVVPTAAPRRAGTPPAVAAVRARPRAVGTRLRWWRSSGRRRRDLERPALDLRPLGRHRLPGTNADTELYEALDAYDRPFGLVLVPRTGHASVAFELQPPRPHLLTGDGARAWTDDLAGWLAALDAEPDLCGCAVGLRPGGPAAPDGSPPLRLTLQLTWRPRGPQGRTDAAAVAAELGGRLPGLVGSLRRGEVGTAAPLPAGCLVREVAAAYHPADDEGLDGAGDLPAGGEDRDDGSAWPDAAPRAADERWDRLRHDRRASLTWTLGDVPAPLALADVLRPVAGAVGGAAGGAAVRPERPGAVVRLTLLHRTPHGGAGDLPVGTDWTGLPPLDAAPLRAPAPGGAPRRPRPRALLTLTVPGGPGMPGRPGGPGATGGPGRPRPVDDLLDDAVRAVLTGVAPVLRPWLRPLYGTQAGALAAALPAGTLLGVHTAAPAVVPGAGP